MFEIEEEFDSALDTTADNNDGFSVLHQRRVSSASSRRHFPSSPPKAIPRARLSSMMNRGFEGQSYSPLAQVFNPVVQEDDANSDPYVSGSSAPQAGISFGLVTRRRLMSIQPSQRRVTESAANPALAHIRGIPAIGDKNSPPKRGAARSRSHDADHSRRPLPKPHQMVTEDIKIAENAMTDERAQFAVLRRLEEMEKRQERIEALLVEISRSVGGPRQPQS